MSEANMVRGICVLHAADCEHSDNRITSVQANEYYLAEQN